MSFFKNPSATYRARKVHRYLGIFLGVQFIMWTVGGLYFSWVNLDAVHGDHLHRAPALLSTELELASPSRAIAALRAREPVDSVVTLELIQIVGKPTYRLRYLSRREGRPTRKVQLADAVSGALRAPVQREEAIAVARSAFAGSAPVSSVSLLTADSVSAHHEYRGQPLPAWAVRFDHGEGATAYVAAELGETMRIRNERWRIFDFLWMLHTMDYQGRDNFNNLALRAFSVLGLVTVLSGFVLFGMTSPVLRRSRRGLRPTPVDAAYR